MRNHSHLAPQNHGPNALTPPRPRTGEGLNKVIRELDQTYHLGLRPRDHTWSPSRSTNSIADHVYDLVKRLYWSSEPALTRALQSFKTEGATKKTQKERLAVLEGSLRAQIPSPRSSQRATSSQTPRDGPHQSIGSPLSRQVLAPLNLSTSLYAAESDSVCRRPQSESPNTEDEICSPPRSPSPSSRAAQRRLQASQTPGSLISRKRPSDSLKDEQKPCKYLITTRGRRSLDGDADVNQSGLPSLRQDGRFKKPELAMAPSFSNASKSSSTLGSFDSTWSQPDESQPDTANTSFATNPDTVDTSPATGLGDVSADTLRLTRMSSPNIGSLEAVQAMTDMVGQAGPSRLPLPVPNVQTRSASRAGTIVNLSASDTGHVNMEPSPHFRQTPSPKMDHNVRNLPNQGLFVGDLPPGMHHAPFIVRLQCCRIALANKIQPGDIMRTFKSEFCSYDSFWKYIEMHPKCPINDVRDSVETWSGTDGLLPDGYTLKAKLQYNHRSKGPLFDLRIDILQTESSCRLQRAFGSERYLYLTVPALNRESIPQRFKSHFEVIRQEWDKWFDAEHAFLGCNWKAFHLEDTDRKKKVFSRNNDESPTKRIVLFATKGASLRTCTVGEMLDWFFPFYLNSHQPFPKAFARLDLALSRTFPTLEFLPHQLEYVDDIKADGTLEDTQFNDMTLDWSEHCPDDVVMNDGCNIMSVGAAREVWRKCKKPGPIPSAFQARLAGAKGMWSVNAAANSKNPEDQAVWIRISNSQRKFKPHTDDLTNGTHDPLRLTFEVIAHSTPPMPANLHIAFIPIMVDRGVSLKTLSNLIKVRLDFERQELLATVTDPETLRHWIHKQDSKTEETHRDHSEPKLQAALPRALGEKIIFLLESGFSPQTSPYLSRCVYRYVECAFAFKESNLSIPLGRATYLFGIADPLGILEPGQIHVQFSTTFYDQLTGEGYFALDDTELLVGRQPACRRSDMQKVRAIRKPELSHLVDVIVFPSKGIFPLAGKLQGGDYDGDKFWICWEPELVEPFFNAPAPLQAPKPHIYGIRVEKRMVKDVMNVGDLSTVHNWLQKSFKFKNNEAMLGFVTNFHEKQCYRENRIHSAALSDLADIHDLLVDSAKQGFTFTRKDFDQYVEKSQYLEHNPPVPAYKSAMKDSAKVKDMAERGNMMRKYCKAKSHNTLDYLFFDVTMAHNTETLKQLGELTRSFKNEEENCLQDLYRKEHDHSDPVARQELDDMYKKLEPVFHHWGAQFRKADDNTNSTWYHDLLDECYNRYKAILPSDHNHPSVKHWMEPWLGTTKWELLRASALAKRYSSRNTAFLFLMAGNELALINASNDPHPRMLTWNRYKALRPRKVKILVLGPEENDSSDEFQTAMEGLL